MGCRHLNVERRYIDAKSLASTYVKSPDPLQKHPPKGEQLWMYWHLPSYVMEQPLVLTLKVVMKNLEEDIVAYPIKTHIGRAVYSIMNDQYTRTGGVLTYRADITTVDGTTIESFKQQLWVKPIRVGE